MRVGRTSGRWLVFLAFAAGAGPGAGQEPTPEPIAERPRVAIDVPSLFRDLGGDPVRPRTRLIGIPGGFLAAPTAAEPAPPAPEDVEPAGGLDVFAHWQVNYGSYNPYLELRRPGDPGGVGYNKLSSQLPLLDLGHATLSLGLQALTPAGLQTGGVQNGATHFLPALAWSQDLAPGTALQGYFGQSILSSPGWTDYQAAGYEYGMAIQCPVPGTCPDGEQGVFVFFQALGRSGADAVPEGRGWEFVPGVQWRVNPNCWMSLGASRYNFLNCGWQY